MRGRCQGYLAYFKVRFLMGMQYRAAAWAGIATQFCFGWVYVFIYKAFYENSQTVQAMSLEELVTYTWLQQSFLMLCVLWNWDRDLFTMIQTGDIAYELCRPYKLYPLWFVRLCAKRISDVLMRCVPLLLFAFLFPEPYNLLPPAGLQAFLLFCLTMLLGLFVTVGLSLFVYMLSFYTLNQNGWIGIMTVVSDLFSGNTMLPIPLMPGWLKTISYLLPFRLAGDLPFRVYSGHIGIKEAWISVGYQFFWILLLFWTGSNLMKRTLRRVVVQGG